ncbi:MAG: polysaccharide biosynthesis C-terminal domain-containing protein [Lachnospiraceae bacterium]|nr:polysaccharide biosynthesis C-terminal domain-containing protein [Lachnospiraceae bacterium]
MKKKFFRYVSQNILGMIGVSCYIIADTFFISMHSGADGITVLNLALPIFNIIFAIGAMIGMGAATRFAIYRAQEKKQADDYFINGIFWSVVLSSVFIVAGIGFPDKVIALMGGNQEIIKLGINYNRIILCFAPFFMLNQIISAFVRNDNAPTLAMVGTLAGSLFNIVFDYVFMFTLGLGLTGAAMATAASPIISIVICSVHFFSKKNTLRIKKIRPTLNILKKSCQLGIAAFIGELSSGVTTMVFNYRILSIAGNTGVAAYGVIANFALVATSVFNGVAQGAQPLVSEEYGKGEKLKVKRLLIMGLITSVSLALVIVMGVYVYTDSLVSLFNSEGNEVLAAYAHTGMRLYFPGFIFAGINIVISVMLSATAHSIASFATSISRGVIGIVGCCIVLSLMFGLDGVWASFMAAEMITCIISIGMIIRTKCLNK